MINLTIDGNLISVPKGTTVFNAAKKLGIDIPIFCYHDSMPPFGACRVCLVEVEKMGRLQASCTLEATEGMVVRTKSSNAVKGREEILEFLLINHPLDCPICDRGGECPLQEHAFSHGPGESRFFEEKRHFTKAWPLGPVLMLDRERCIVCARCTRFSDEISGDHALEMIDRGFKTEVGTPDGGTAESKFIGNTIMICPVGALTSQVYRFRARPWDNEPTNTTCTLCPVGCSMIIDSRDGEIMRTRSRENKNVNDIWLCDKGWFGYEFSTHPDRLKEPLIRKNNQLTSASWDEAFTFISNQIQAAKPSGKLAAIGGNPLTVEENYLFQKLMREVIGVPHVDHRLGISLDEEGIPPGMELSIGDCETLHKAFLFGVNLTEEFPVIWLRLRQGINRGTKVHFFGHILPEIARYLTKTTLHAPGTELDILKRALPVIETELDGSKPVAFFVGSQYLNTPNRLSILSELTKFKQKHPQITINILEGQGNSMGARYAGMHPDFGPMNQSIANKGLNSSQVIEQAASQGWDFLYIAGANPVKKFSNRLWNGARSKLKCLVVQDLFLTETAQQADVVLPVLSYVEKGGSFINIEGRVQQLLPGKEIPENIYSDAAIFLTLASKLNAKLTNDPVFIQSLKTERISLKNGNSWEGKAVSLNESSLSATFLPMLFDDGVRMKHDSHLFQLVKPPYVRIHPQEGLKRGIRDDEQLTLSANGNSIQVKIQLDKNVSLGTVAIPLQFDEIPVYELGTKLYNGLPIELKK